MGKLHSQPGFDDGIGGAEARDLGRLAGIVNGSERRPIMSEDLLVTPGRVDLQPELGVGNGLVLGGASPGRRWCWRRAAGQT